MTHTKVRSRRGKLVHAVTLYGERRDLAPEDIPALVCGKKIKGAVVCPDDYVTCPVCVEILFDGN